MKMLSFAAPLGGGEYTKNEIAKVCDKLNRDARSLEIKELLIQWPGIFTLLRIIQPRIKGSFSRGTCPLLGGDKK